MAGTNGGGRGGSGGSKGGSSGKSQASPAALMDDEDVLSRLRGKFHARQKSARSRIEERLTASRGVTYPRSSTK